MREIIGHKINPAKPEPLVIEAVDEPGPGGANHRYHITGFDAGSNPSREADENAYNAVVILFQNGPIAEVGVNGITVEALIAICIDRLKSFQEGPYACPENGAAWAHLAMAQSSLFARTLNRQVRGVEGTSTV